MSTLRTALLVAAATVAVLPTLAAAQAPPEQNRNWQGRDGHDDRGDHGDRGNHGERAPQNGAQPGQQVQPVQAPRPNSGYGQAGRGPNRDDRGERGFQGDRRGFAAGERRPDDRSQGDRHGYDSRGGPDWNRGGERDHGRDGGFDRQQGWDRNHVAGYDRQSGYDRNRVAGYDRQPGWDRGRGGWREDRRYDWHGWRDQNRALFRGPRYIAPRGFGYRPYAVGYRLPPFFYGRTYWIDDPYAFRLPPADGPYRWVRYYNDVLLVDLRTGTVVDVINQFFW